jgi:hypothetical protein
MLTNTSGRSLLAFQGQSSYSPTISCLSPFGTSNGPPLSPWHESIAPLPAHNMYEVILDALYFIALHWESVRMGTSTSCTTLGSIPPSVVRPHPTTVPVFPAGSLPTRQQINHDQISVSGAHQSADKLDECFWWTRRVFGASRELCRGCTTLGRNSCVWLWRIPPSSWRGCLQWWTGRGLPEWCGFSSAST